MSYSRPARPALEVRKSLDLPGRRLFRVQLYTDNALLREGGDHLSTILSRLRRGLCPTGVRQPSCEGFRLITRNGCCPKETCMYCHVVILTLSDGKGVVARAVSRWRKVLIDGLSA